MVRPVLLSLRCDGGTPGCTVREICVLESRVGARHRIRRLQKVKCNIKYRYFWY